MMLPELRIFLIARKFYPLKDTCCATRHRLQAKQFAYVVELTEKCKGLTDEETDSLLKSLEDGVVENSKVA
jgi:hypothetical protein